MVSFEDVALCFVVSSEPKFFLCVKHGLTDLIIMCEFGVCLSK